MRVTVSAKGQIVLPKSLRDGVGLAEGDQVDIELDEGRLVIEPVVRARAEDDWKAWRGHLAGSGALESHAREHADEVTAERLP